MTENGSSNGLVMPVAPMYGGYGNGGFGNSFGGDWAWIILLLLLGWGNGNGGFGGGFGFGMDGVMPYMWNTQTQNDVNRGFDNACLTSQLSGIQTSLTSGFANAEVAGCNRAMDAMQTAYNNQIASMNQRFADMSNLNQNFNSLQSALAQCCCDNRLAVANLGSDIAREACADRQAVNDGVRDILASQNAGIQRILDKLCEQELFAERRENDNLRTQLNMANLSASQTRQTADIQNSIISELRSCPIPSQPVYGSQPIFTCNNTGGCGCGCGGNF